MSPRAATIVVILVGLVGWVAWDVYAALNGVPGDTISEIVLAYSRQVRTLPLALGIVAGHLLWPLSRVNRRFVRLGVLGALIGLTIFLDLWGLPTHVPILYFVVGVPLGHWLWPQ